MNQAQKNLLASREIEMLEGAAWIAEHRAKSSAMVGSKEEERIALRKLTELETRIAYFRDLIKSAERPEQ